MLLPEDGIIILKGGDSMNDMPKHFPSNRREALAYEYVKLHMTKEMSPEELVRLYVDALARINAEFSTQNPQV